MLYSFNHFQLDVKNFSLEHHGQKIAVEPRVFDLIVYLIQNQHRVVTRDELFQQVWHGRNVLDATLSNHIKGARSVLGDNGQSQHTIKTIHGRGYQFIAQAKHNSVQSQRTKSKINFKPKVFVASLVLLLAFIINNFYKDHSDDKIPTIAVLPFTNNNSSPQNNYFSIAIADQIIGHLNYLQNISVRPTLSIRKYININDPISIGKELNVDYVLTGSYHQLDDKIRLSIELVDVKTSELIWRGKQIEVENDNTFKLQDLVAQKVIDGLKIKFSSSEIKRINQDIPSNPLAYEYYLRAVAYPYTIDDNKLAIGMLAQSLELDASYALTYVHLGDRIRRVKQFSLQDLAFHNLPFQKAEEYYQKALLLNPELLSALSNLSFLYTETNRLEQAVELVKKMVKINPNHTDTLFSMGYIYRYVGMVDEAITAMEKAVNLDPHNQHYRSLIGTYSNAKMYHKALKMTDFYPKSAFTLGWKGLLNRRLGHNEIALDYFNQVLESEDSGLWSNVAIIFKSYINGKPEIGLQAIKKLTNPAESDGETLYYLSSYYALLGDKDNAIKTLEKAINAGYYNYAFMTSNSYFDKIKNEPQFKNLLKQAYQKHLDIKESLLH